MSVTLAGILSEATPELKAADEHYRTNRSAQTFRTWDPAHNKGPPTQQKRQQGLPRTFALYSRPESDLVPPSKPGNDQLISRSNGTLYSRQSQVSSGRNASTTINEMDRKSVSRASSVSLGNGNDRPQNGSMIQGGVAGNKDDKNTPPPSSRRQTADRSALHTPYRLAKTDNFQERLAAQNKIEQAQKTAVRDRNLTHHDVPPRTFGVTATGDEPRRHGYQWRSQYGYPVSRSSYFQTPTTSSATGREIMKSPPLSKR